MIKYYDIHPQKLDNILIWYRTDGITWTPVISQRLNELTDDDYNAQVNNYKNADAYGGKIINDIQADSVKFPAGKILEYFNMSSAALENKLKETVENSPNYLLYAGIAVAVYFFFIRK